MSYVLDGIETRIEARLHLRHRGLSPPDVDRAVVTQGKWYLVEAHIRPSRIRRITDLREGNPWRRERRFTHAEDLWINGKRKVYLL